MIESFTVLEGGSYVVEKQNLPRAGTINLAKGSLLLHSEVVTSNGTEYLEVWVATPHQTGPTEPSVEDLGVISVDDIRVEVEFEEGPDE